MQNQTAEPPRLILDAWNPLMKSAKITGRNNTAALRPIIFSTLTGVVKRIATCIIVPSTWLKNTGSNAFLYRSFSLRTSPPLSRRNVFSPDV